MSDSHMSQITKHPYGHTVASFIELLEHQVKPSCHITFFIKPHTVHEAAWLYLVHIKGMWVSKWTFLHPGFDSHTLDDNYKWTWHLRETPYWCPLLKRPAVDHDQGAMCESASETL